MAYNISDFYNTAVQRDFARQFQFALVSIGNTNFLTENELVYVETASLPGKTITNVPVPYMGLSFNVPGTVNYPGSSNYAVTFRCDSNYLIRSQLEESLRILFDDATSTGDYGIPSAASTMSLALFNKGPVNGSRSVIRTYTMYGVWCQNLADAAYDIKDTGSVVQIQATIAYQYWRVAGATGTNTSLASVSKPGPFPSIR
jgi:hypothetical protein